MSYEKQAWQTGEVITANKLNHMEDGIANGGVLVVGVTDDGTTATMDKTWQQIYDADLAVCPQFVQNYGKVNNIITEIKEGDVYAVTIEGIDFTTDSPDGYPSYAEQ